jgi:hypothetical protein
MVQFQLTLPVLPEMAMNSVSVSFQIRPPREDEFETGRLTEQQLHLQPSSHVCSKPKQTTTRNPFSKRQLRMEDTDVNKIQLPLIKFFICD